MLSGDWISIACLVCLLLYFSIAIFVIDGPENHQGPVRKLSERTDIKILQQNVPAYTLDSEQLQNCVQLLCLVANAFIERRKLQIQGNTITVSLAAAADDGGEVVRDDVLLRTVVVHDVSDDMEEVVCVYLENPKKNGGPIESSFYNQDTRQLSVCFVSLQGRCRSLQ